MTGDGVNDSPTLV
ncbi:hypothetical protein H17ap60334_10585 [Thermosipho africanus H17ap60334]|nr:hypothetical protein H17ap60334_10585 [Thermosipho africanus H17ap60334]